VRKGKGETRHQVANAMAGPRWPETVQLAAMPKCATGTPASASLNAAALQTSSPWLEVSDSRLP